MANKPLKISACLVVYNEEQNIARCLESLKGAVDEIILVHDGDCGDKTLAIAETYGAKIFIRPRVGGAEEHRPFSYEQAAGDWILQIDADEFLSTELSAGLRGLAADPDAAAYEFWWPLWDGKKSYSARWPYKRCFFRKDKAHFLGILQFVVAIDGPVKRVAWPLWHQPAYNNYSWSIFKAKQLPWAKLQAVYYARDFSALTKFNYSGTDWPRHINWRRQHPLLLLPAEFLVTFFKNLWSGAYRAGWLGVKVSFQAGLYRAAVNYYIFKFKNQ